MDEKQQLSNTDIETAEASQAVGSRIENNKKNQEKEKKKKKKNRVGITILKVVIWIIVIAVAIFLTLYFASKIGEFNSIGDMLNYIKSQF